MKMRGRWTSEGGDGRPPSHALAPSRALAGRDTPAQRASADDARGALAGGADAGLLREDRRLHCRLPPGLRVQDLWTDADIARAGGLPEPAHAPPAAPHPLAPPLP